MVKKKLPEIQIIEMLLVKCGNDWTRTYMAQIRREFDAAGNHIICGEVVVEEGKIWSMANDEAILAYNLDEICKLKLDMGIHKCSGSKFEDGEIISFLN